MVNGLYRNVLQWPGLEHITNIDFNSGEKLEAQKGAHSVGSSSQKNLFFGVPSETFRVSPISPCLTWPLPRALLTRRTGDLKLGS